MANKNHERASADRGSNLGAPRWVKAFGIVAVILVVAFVVMHLTGHGLHGHGAR